MKKFIALDTETESVDFKSTLSRLQAEPVGVSASWDGINALYSESRSEWLEMLSEINSEGLTTIWHNFKFDTQVLSNAALPQPELWEDTAIAGILLNENRINKLKPLAAKLLGIKDPMAFDEADKNKVFNPEIFAEYAMNDARYTYKLWEIFEPQLEQEDLMTVYKLEKNMVPVALEIENNGMLMNAKKAANMASKVTDEVDTLRWSIYIAAGRQFNINSPKQLAEVLFDDLKLKPTKYSKKTGAPSTDKETLADLENEHPVVASLIEFRKLDHLSSSFLNALPRFLDENNRIHGTYNSTGTKTGRSSMSNPNLQNIPVKTELGKQLRSCFIAPKGGALIIADYSQMELRVLAEYLLKKTGDRTMFDILASGADLHIATAESMFQKSVGKDDRERKAAKWINFGIVYGLTDMGLQNRLKAEGINITKQEAGNYINLYMRTYPGIAEYKEIVEDLTMRRGYIRNLYGRKRRVAGWDQRGKRQALNYTIQGSCADIIKHAMVNLYNEFKNDDGIKAVGMIHDETIYEVKDKRTAEKYRNIVKETMTVTPPGFRLSLPVDATIGNSWAEKA